MLFPQHSSRTVTSYCCNGTSVDIVLPHKEPLLFETIVCACCAGFLFPAGFYLYHVATRRIGYTGPAWPANRVPEDHSLGSLSCIITAVGYIAKALDFMSGGDSEFDLNSVWYVEYSITCPMILLDLFFALDLGGKLKYSIIICLTLICGVASFAVTDITRFGYYIMGCCLFFPVVLSIPPQIWSLSHYYPAPCRRYLMCASVLLFAGWPLFPAVWILSPQGLGIIEEHEFIVIHAIVDVVCKTGFGLCLLHFRKEVEEYVFVQQQELIHPKSGQRLRQHSVREMSGEDFKELINQLKNSQVPNSADVLDETELPTPVPVQPSVLKQNQMTFEFGDQKARALERSQSWQTIRGLQTHGSFRSRNTVYRMAPSPPSSHLQLPPYGNSTAAAAAATLNMLSHTPDEHDNTAGLFLGLFAQPTNMVPNMVVPHVNDHEPTDSKSLASTFSLSRTLTDMSHTAIEIPPGHSNVGSTGSPNKGHTAAVLGAAILELSRVKSKENGRKLTLLRQLLDETINEFKAAGFSPQQTVPPYHDVHSKKKDAEQTGLQGELSATQQVSTASLLDQPIAETDYYYCASRTDSGNEAVAFTFGVIPGSSANIEHTPAPPPYTRGLADN